MNPRGPVEWPMVVKEISLHAARVFCRITGVHAGDSAIMRDAIIALGGNPNVHPLQPVESSRHYGRGLFGPWTRSRCAGWSSPETATYAFRAGASGVPQLEVVPPLRASCTS